MKRGPKVQEPRTRADAGSCQRECPDEEGTKGPPVRPPWPAPPPGQRECPDEEGTKVPFLTHSHWEVLCFGVRGNAPMKRGPKVQEPRTRADAGSCQRECRDEERTKERQFLSLFQREMVRVCPLTSP